MTDVLNLQVEELLSFMIAAFTKQDYEDCLSAGLKLREHFPQIAQAWSIPVYSCLQMGKLEEANRLAKEGLEQAPHFTDSWAGWAQISSFAQDWSEAAIRWATMRSKFPQCAMGYAKGAHAAFEQGDLSQAENLALEALAFPNDNPEAELILGQIALHKKQYEKAAEIFTQIREKFPTDPTAFFLGAHTHSLAGSVEKAEIICIDGMRNFPNSFNLLAQYAELAEQSGDPQVAASRWQRVRRKFPTLPAGYARESILLIKKEALKGIASLMKDAEASGLKGTDISVLLPPDFVGNLMSQAKRAMAARHYTLTLLAYYLMRKLYPYKEEGYTDAAWIYIQLGNFKKAEDICRSGLAINDNFGWTAYALGNALGAQSKKYLAELCLNSTAISYCDNILLVKCIIESLANIGCFESAISLYERYLSTINNDPELIKLKFKLEISRSHEIHINLLKELFGKFIILVNAQDIKGNVFKELLDVARIIGKTDNIYNVIHRCILISSLRKILNNKYPALNGKICFYFYTNSIVPFFSSIVKHFNYERVNIVLREDCDKEDIEKWGLENYNITNDLDKLKNYKFIICDAALPPALSEDAYSIGLIHSLDWQPSKNEINNVDAVIFAAKNYATYNYIELLPEEKPYLHLISPKTKCEMAFAGPYQIDGVPTNKMSLRKTIAQRHNIVLTEDRPFLLFIEDWHCHFGQLIHCINKLAEHCTVCLKLYMPHPYRHLLSILDPNVIVIDKFLLESNLYRFSADFVFSGLYSGSVFTNIMADIPLIVYYSRFLDGKMDANMWPAKVSLSQHINIFKNYHEIFKLSHQWRLLTLLNENDMLFDILNIKKIHDAVFNHDYTQKYHQIAEEARTSIFGDFIIHGSAAKAAALIEHFIAHGTFGENCEAISLK